MPVKAKILSDPSMRFVIINDTDQPAPKMICGWRDGVGYCYLDRAHGKPQYDGMIGKTATSLEEFGITWRELEDGNVHFSPNGAPPTATYPDGKPRKWQHHLTDFILPGLKRTRARQTPAP